ncbi:MAG: SH3 domain-containing protein [Chloroflexota bacterium]|nr:SH3 domain-containing protein [Chloroflexota bacterium]MDE2909509.1 SH3 domain-containing protein [Chloroflexota bacterium]
MRKILILLLAAVVLGACARPPDAAPPTATTLLRLTPRRAATFAPTAAAYPTLTPHVFCAGTMESFLIVGERGRVTLTEDGKWLNLRAGPGAAYDVIGRLAPLASFMVLDGARCDGAYTWYQVDYRGAVGWIAEGGDGQYFAEPWLTG